MSVLLTAVEFFEMACRARSLGVEEGVEGAFGDFCCGLCGDVFEDEIDEVLFCHDDFVEHLHLPSP